MPEVTNERAQKLEARPDADHGITITEVHLPAGTPLRASCLCGWQSPIVPSRPQAKAHGNVHESEVAREHARSLRESIEAQAHTAAEDGGNLPPSQPTDGSESSVMSGDLSAANMYLHVQGVLADDGDIPDDRVGYVMDVMNILDAVPALAELDGSTRRDAIGIFTILDGNREGPLHEALYRSALNVVSHPPRHLDGTASDGVVLAAALRAIASRIELTIMSHHAGLIRDEVAR